METKADILNKTSQQFPALLVATEMVIFDQTMGQF